MLINAPQFDANILMPGNAVVVAEEGRFYTGIIFDFSPIEFKIGYPKWKGSQGYQLEALYVTIGKILDGRQSILLLQPTQAIDETDKT